MNIFNSALDDCYLSTVCLVSVQGWSNYFLFEADFRLRASDNPEPSQAPLKTLQKPEMSVLTIKPLGVRPGEATEAHEGQSHKHKTINQTALVRDNLHDIRYMHLNDEHDRTPVLLLKDTTDCTTPVIIDESTDLAQTAEDYSIELDSVCTPTFLSFDMHRHIGIYDQYTGLLTLHRRR